jgi:hypothetical protein
MRKVVVVATFSEETRKFGRTAELGEQNGQFCSVPRVGLDVKSEIACKRSNSFRRSML